MYVWFPISLSAVAGRALLRTCWYRSVLRGAGVGEVRAVRTPQRAVHAFATERRVYPSQFADKIAGPTVAALLCAAFSCCGVVQCCVYSDEALFSLFSLWCSEKHLRTAAPGGAGLAGSLRSYSGVAFDHAEYVLPIAGVRQQCEMLVGAVLQRRR